jgi:hypothetical protein
VQYIATVQHFASPDHFWGLSFTQEVPLAGMRHQLSWTIPFVSAHERDRLGLSDISIHYRLQALDGSSGLAISPRVSIFVPTGAPQSRGEGVVSWQANLPVSVELSRAFVVHFNAGATLTPNQEIDSRVWGYPVSEDLMSYNVGGSLVWLTLPNLNVLCEILHTATDEFGDGGRVDQIDETILNPGVRIAINASFGQFVPGITMPVRFVNDQTDVGVFGYLSFEHSY